MKFPLSFTLFHSLCGGLDAKTNILRQALLYLILSSLFFTTINAQKEELRLEILNGHSGGGVLAVAVSSDGKFALTGSDDQTALLWDLETGKQLRRFFGYHEDAVSCVQFSKDGRFVLTASYDSTAQLWETATGRRVHGFGESRNGLLIKHSGKILSCAISADMKMVATAGEDKTARIWDFETGRQLFELKHAGRVNSIAFSPDSRFLLTGGEDKIARLYSTANGKEERQFVGHTKKITSVAYSPEGNKIATASWDGTVCLWNASNSVEIKRFNYFNLYNSTHFTSDGKKIVAGGDSGRSIHIWDIESGNQVWSHEGNVKSAVITPDEQKILILNNEREENFVRIIKIKDNTEKQLIGYSDVIHSVDVSLDSRLIITGSVWDDWIIGLSPEQKESGLSGLWNLNEGQAKQWWKERTKIKTISSFKNKEEFENPAYYSHVSFDKDHKFDLKKVKNRSNSLELSIQGRFEETVKFSPNSLLLAISGVGTEIWNIAENKKLYELDSKSFSFSPDSKTLYTLSQRNDNVFIESRESKTGLELRKFAVDYYGKVEEISPDGKTIAIINSNLRLSLYDVATGAPKLIKDFSVPIWSATFSPDGKTIATAGGGEVDMTTVGIGDAGKANGVRFFDVETGKERERFWGDFKTSINKFPGFTSVAYSPDGKFLAAGSFDDEVYIRNNETGELRQFEGHTDTVNSVKFAKDANGKLLVVSGSSDSTTRIWDAATGEEICALVTFRDGNWAVVQTSTGRYDAPNGGEIEGIQWVFGTETIELEQLSAMYYTPNLLPRLLGYNKEALTPVVPLRDIKLFPEIVSQTLGADGKTLELKLRNRGGGIGKTEIYVNNSLAVPDARGKDLQDNPFPHENEIKTLIVDLTGAKFGAKVCEERGGKVLCRNADDEIRVVTSNHLKEIGKGNIQSRGSVSVRTAKDKDKYTLPSLYAIVAGVSDYGPTTGGDVNDPLDLSFAAKDAEDFSNALRLGAKRLFCPAENADCVDKVEIRTLSTNRKTSDEQPTKENIKKAFAEIARKAKPEDIVVIYLSGHGVTLGTNTDSYFYLTKDARSASKEFLAQTFQTDAVSNEELARWLTLEEWSPGEKGVKAQKQVLILDTCAAGNFAGEDDWKKDKNLSGDQIRAIEFLKDKTGTFILMGSSANKPSYEANRYGQGLLTYSLLEGMKGGGLKDAAGLLDVRKWFGYAETRVPTLAKDIGIDQRPIIKQPAGGDFVIGQLTDTEKSKIALPNIKPIILRPLLTNPETGDDDQKLIEKLGKMLEAESSYTVARQRGANETLLVYVNSDSFDGAVRLTGTYTVEGENIRINKAFLRRDGQTIVTLPENLLFKQVEAAAELFKIVRAELLKL